jgi:hypothetical protein
LGQGTSIIVNGGSVIGLTDEFARTGTGALALETGTFRSVFEPPLAAAFKQDGTGTYALQKEMEMESIRTTHKQIKWTQLQGRYLL